MRISDWSSDVCSSDLTSTTWPASRNRVDRMRRFLALSRSLHGVLDIAMPGFVALLWLGRFPDWRVLAICLGPPLAGYTANYALDDLVGAQDDQNKLNRKSVCSGKNASVRVNIGG